MAHLHESMSKLVPSGSCAVPATLTLNHSDPAFPWFRRILLRDSAILWSLCFGAIRFLSATLWRTTWRGACVPDRSFLFAILLKRLTGFPILSSNTFLIYLILQRQLLKSTKKFLIRICSWSRTRLTQIISTTKRLVFTSKIHGTVNE